MLAARATNRGGASLNPGGLLIRFIVEYEGDTRELVTGQSGWRCADAEHDGWQRPDFDDSAWPAAKVLAPYGEGPWGNGVQVPVAERPGGGGGGGGCRGAPDTPPPPGGSGRGGDDKPRRNTA
ncbi:hypothetical protein, partial [Streptomyces lasiicapitis]|uniref:hypothetical protein n=1 Tax=Streptomyces lasiicapitis TaxID=1923961 RepID=UPI00369B4CF4